MINLLFNRSGDEGTRSKKVPTEFRTRSKISFAMQIIFAAQFPREQLCRSPDDERVTSVEVIINEAGAPATSMCTSIKLGSLVASAKQLIPLLTEFHSIMRRDFHRRLKCQRDSYF